VSGTATGIVAGGALGGAAGLAASLMGLAIPGYRTDPRGRADRRRRSQAQAPARLPAGSSEA
jgi:hypothetical protein